MRLLLGFIYKGMAVVGLLAAFTFIYGVHEIYAAEKTELYFDIKREGGGSIEEINQKEYIVTNDTVEIEVKTEINLVNIAQLYIKCDGDVKKADRLLIESGKVEDIRAYYVDVNGNKSMEYECPYGVLVDTRMPEMELSENTKDGVIEISGDISDAGAGLAECSAYLNEERIYRENYRVKDRMVKNDDISFEVSLAELTDVDNDLIIDVLDRAGNKSRVKWKLRLQNEAETAADDSVVQVIQESDAEKDADKKGVIIKQEKCLDDSAYAENIVSQANGTAYVDDVEMSDAETESDITIDAENIDSEVTTSSGYERTNMVSQADGNAAVDDPGQLEMVREVHVISPLQAEGRVIDETKKPYQILLVYIVSALMVSVSFFVMVKDYRSRR